MTPVFGCLFHLQVKPAVLLLLALMALSLGSPLNIRNGDSFLEWVTWNNSLPNNSVSIYNYYVGRTDYVCKYNRHAGFYSPSKGTYCHYANAKKEYTGFPFEVLVNKDNFEILEWKCGSRGSVPKNSVRTCPGENMYVGKNKYGLGKVIQNKAFYLPWKGYEYSYNDYQVLTISENIVRQQIDNVRYITHGSEMIKYPTEIMRVSTIKNLECHPVLRTDTLSKTYQVSNIFNQNGELKARKHAKHGYPSESAFSP
uniref:Uncharacterized protein n=1 Tax=Labrus bergylta TaxID=56723 RepID=A0A3Q3FGS8_9LABR